MWKLWKMGVGGRMLDNIHEFLNRFCVNDHTTEWKETYVGIPQGAILSPTL